MTRGGRRRAAAAMTCLSCGALLSSPRSFCDDQCQRFADEHGYRHYSATKQDRNLDRRRGL